MKMKNKKNKKKVLSIVALAATFVLCIGATFGITLAYFGGNATGSITDITLKTGVTVGAAARSSVDNNLVVPGQPVNITCTATIEPYEGGTANSTNAVPGLLRAKFTTGGDMSVTATISAEKVTATNGEGYWVDGGDGYHYFCTSASGKQLVALSATAANEVTMSGSFTVPTSLDNDDSGQTFTASVVFEVAQGELWNGATQLQATDLTYDNATVLAAFNAIKAA